MKKFMSVMTAVIAVCFCAVLPVCAMYEPIDYIDITVPDTLDAVQWLPCREGYERDDLWEVQCIHFEDGTTFAQRFDETAEDTGNTNYLDTVRNDDGSLTILRNGADGEEGVYAPYIRTLFFDNMPFWNMDVGNTLHFDFEATDGWSISLSFGNEHTVVLDEAIAKACEMTPEDGVVASGRYTGTLNLSETLRTMATHNEAAAAVLAMENIPVPHITIYCIGEVESALTMYKWLISTPEDSEGDYCYFACMDVMTAIASSSETDCFPRSQATSTTSVTTTSTAATTASVTQATASPATGNRILPLLAVSAVLLSATTLACVLKKTNTP